MGAESLHRADDPLTAAKATALEHRYPFLKSLFEQRRPQTLTLALFGNRGTSFASPADIESGQQTLFDGANNGILMLDGPGPPLRVVMVIPDGVAKVAFVLPRQAYPGAMAYPAPETITVPVHDNIAAFQTDRYIDQDHWSMVGMIWYAPSGAIVKRIGDFSQLNSVRPDPMLGYLVRTEYPSKWDSLTVIPHAGSTSTTFTIAFRRPLTGAYRYAFRFSGPTPRTGCYSPVNQAIIRGPDLGIPSASRGQIASTQFSSQTWCAGTYRVSVAPATRASQPAIQHRGVHRPTVTTDWAIAPAQCHHGFALVSVRYFESHGTNAAMRGSRALHNCFPSRPDTDRRLRQLCRCSPLAADLKLAADGVSLTQR